MAKVTAPLLSFGGSGQVGKTQVYASWRGVKYARRYVIPANPQSTKQTYVRDTMNFFSQVWKLLDPAVQVVWTAFTKGKQLYNRNAFIQKGVPACYDKSTGTMVADLENVVMSPGVGGGYAAAAFTPTDGGSQHITATMTAPTIPSDWAVVKAHAVAIKQQQANTGTVFETFYASDDSSPYAPDLDVGVAETYAAFGFFEYTNGNGDTVYGPSTYAAVVVA